MITKKISNKLAESRASLARLKRLIPKDVNSEHEFLKGVQMRLDASHIEGGLAALEWIFSELQPKMKNKGAKNGK